MCVFVCVCARTCVHTLAPFPPTMLSGHTFTLLCHLHRTMHHGSNRHKCQQPPQGATLCQPGPHPTSSPLLSIRQGEMRPLTLAPPPYAPPLSTWNSLPAKPCN